MAWIENFYAVTYITSFTALITFAGLGIQASTSVGAYGSDVSKLLTLRMGHPDNQRHVLYLICNF